MQPEYDNIVFCDFDGTITVQETFSTMLMEMVPDKARQVLEQIYAGKATLAQGVRMLVESLPSSAYGDIIDFCQGKEIRPGFVEFLDFLDKRGVPFILVSGGLHVMAQAILGPLTKRLAGVYSLSLDLDGPNMRVLADFEEGDELMAKAKVMGMYNYKHSIAIGDGVTDLNMGLAAQTVFARASLAKYMDKNNLEYIPYQDFFEIKDHLEQMWSK
ncbi:2-hydroxy-3-keto-5-methylthiopentenyl-1-phosphatephosphatase [Desulfatibacillum alkenivorans DSM 16219]|jgi:2-hydroxy-3-keto-5-methylthiopentenyl-1-phosphate phosphatase|uniref:2-hydroxy-3-keto-5-methylthiopentenyl-1-phosphate phosphatase n=1 Tax=Desulfatibacillum alkenivorans DSM 16219 TaxID=1121393 RepID=A0A1M6Q515_9BACT|nr:HAD-IB family phosphatase [Desulfatibacillum alkenivorans]SHK15292.1 2-hydroxy-3-keto-5-methylthiopentenyl-1-phosphatephosphatase [Desulfatibacillum alkenivorans DSM 16219]